MTDCTNCGTNTNCCYGGYCNTCCPNYSHPCSFYHNFSCCNSCGNSYPYYCSAGYCNNCCTTSCTCMYDLSVTAVTISGAIVTLTLSQALDKNISAGTCITQSSSGATGTVQNDTAIGETTIVITDVSGTFVVGDITVGTCTCCASPCHSHCTHYNHCPCDEYNTCDLVCPAGTVACVDIGQFSTPCSTASAKNCKEHIICIRNKNATYCCCKLEVKSITINSDGDEATITLSSPLTCGIQSGTGVTLVNQAGDEKEGTVKSNALCCEIILIITGSGFNTWYSDGDITITINNCNCFENLPLSQFKKMFYADGENLYPAEPPQCHDISSSIVESAWSWPDNATHQIAVTNYFEQIAKTLRYPRDNCVPIPPPTIKIPGLTTHKIKITNTGSHVYIGDNNVNNPGAGEEEPTVDDTSGNHFIMSIKQKGGAAIGTSPLNNIPAYISNVVNKVEIIEGGEDYTVDDVFDISQNNTNSDFVAAKFKVIAVDDAGTITEIELIKCGMHYSYDIDTDPGTMSLY